MLKNYLLLVFQKQRFCLDTKSKCQYDSKVLRQKQSYWRWVDFGIKKQTPTVKVTTVRLIFQPLRGIVLCPYPIKGGREKGRKLKEGSKETKGTQCGKEGRRGKKEGKKGEDEGLPFFTFLPLSSVPRLSSFLPSRYVSEAISNTPYMQSVRTF